VARALTPSSANEFIEQQLDQGIQSLKSHFGAAVLSFNGPLYGGVDTIIRNVVEKLHGDNPDNKKLVNRTGFPGGSIL
jgi:hypothetical protein